MIQADLLFATTVVLVRLSAFAYLVVRVVATLA